MANQTAVVVRITVDTKEHDVKFGKTDRIMKLGYPIGATSLTGVLFVGRSGRTFLADFSRYPDAIKSVMVFHGSKQKLGDEYADMDNEDDCFEAVISLDERLAEGKWSADRQGVAGISVLLKAVMEVFGLEEKAAREFLKPLSKEEKAALKISPELKTVVDRIETERAKGADVSGLMEKLKQAKQS